MKLGYALSPCWEISSPNFSSRSVTLRGVNILTIPTHISVPTTAIAIVMRIPSICAANNLHSPYTRPSHFATELIELLPKIPVAMPPQIPPMPWQPNASRASSIFNFFFTKITP